MKKISFMALALATSLVAGAQANVVKDAERAMKAKEPAAKVVEIITPAFTNPETSTQAKTWYIPGKASYQQYDKMLGLKQFNQLKEGDDIVMGKLLISGYDYLMKALPLDTVVDAKGKPKTVHSNDIVNVIAAHMSDYSSAGVDMYNARDYKGAYELWGIFCNLDEVPALREYLVKQKQLPTDTIFGEIAFNRALAAWQAENLEGALGAFDYARRHAYDKKQLFDYAIAVATQLNDSVAVLEYSRAALPLYGKEDPMYMGQIVNYYLQKKDFDNAFATINEAIQAEPDNAQYYVIRGVLSENADKRPDAKVDYKKAMELDPANAQAVYNYGRMLCEEAYALNDNAPTDQNEYNKYYAEQIKPLFEKAVTILEEAYSLNSENTDVLRYLENVYYNLNDEKMLEDVRNRMKY